jgi:hypothetical protein
LRAVKQSLAKMRVLGASLAVAGGIGAAILVIDRPMLGPAYQASEAPATPDTALSTASAEMVAPPFGTPLALMADPRQLRELTIRSIADYEATKHEAAQIAAMRKIQAAASLGYGPARDLILANFLSSRVVRTAVPAPDVVRYGMDVFAIGPTRTNSHTRAFLPLARYFVQRNEVEAFATHVIEAVRDDARLQKGNALDQLFEALAQVGSACQAIARAVSAPRAVDLSKCPAALKMSVLASVRSAGPVYRDDRARRQALSLIEELKGGEKVERVGDAAPRLIMPQTPHMSSAAESSDSGR